jgi:hypothetical protein
MPQAPARREAHCAAPGEKSDKRRPPVTAGPRSAPQRDNRTSAESAGAVAVRLYFH